MKTLFKKTLSLLLIITPLLGFSQENSIELCKDIMTDKEYVYFKKDLLCSDDGKKGFIISIRLKMNDGKSVYDGLYVKSSGIGSCVENNTLTFLFEDSTKFNIGSWNKFNCEGTSYMDFQKNKFDDINTKKVKAIRFSNGRTYDSYTYQLKDSEKSYFINCENLINSGIFKQVPCEE